MTENMSRSQVRRLTIQKAGDGKKEELRRRDIFITQTCPRECWDQKKTMMAKSVDGTPVFWCFLLNTPKCLTSLRVERFTDPANLPTVPDIPREVPNQNQISVTAILQGIDYHLAAIQARARELLEARDRELKKINIGKKT